MANQQLVVVHGGVAATQRSAMREVRALMARIAASDAGPLLADLANAMARTVALVNRSHAGNMAIIPGPHTVRCESADAISVPLAGDLHEMERFIIDEVIRRCRGNKAAAARTLGLNRRTLYRILGKSNGVKDEG